MRFLTRLLGFFFGSRSSTQRDLSSTVEDSETVARFLFSSKHFAESIGRVKHHAFTPQNGETSVFRVSGISEDEIWRIGGSAAGAGRGVAPRGRANLVVDGIRKLRLDVYPSPTSHERHADIVGWPSEFEKEKLLRMELAKIAVLSRPLR